MPVIGEPASFHVNLLRPQPNDAVRLAVLKLAHLFPKPHSYITSFGFNLRKRRMAMELSEFDFLHRLRRGCPASTEQLYRAGEAIIRQHKPGFPARAPHLDEPLFVNPASFDSLAAIAAAAQETSKEGDNP